MKTLYSFLTVLAFQILTLGSAIAGAVGPAEVELVGSYSTVTVTGSTANDIKTVVKPLSKAALCGLLNISPSKHVLLSISNSIILVNKTTGAAAATFMTFGTQFQTGNDFKGMLTYDVQFFSDADSVGSYVAKYKYSSANDFYILTGKFQGATENPPVIVGGGAPSGLFFQGKVVYVKPYNGPLL